MKKNQKHVKGDGFYHKKQDKPHRGSLEKKNHEKDDESVEEEATKDKSKTTNNQQPKSTPSTKSTKTSNNKSNLVDPNVPDDANETDTTSSVLNEDNNIQTLELPGSSDGRQITLAMTRSGAINALSSRFLRDSDEAVHVRKIAAPEPFHHKKIEPRIYTHLPFPTRQDWTAAKSGEELDKMETAYFEGWLDDIYKNHKIEQISPFEHNLEVWRQLWRVLEKSDVIVVLADIRDPLLHIPLALVDHVKNIHKLPVLIVLTKCDLVSEEHANNWKRFLEQAFNVVDDSTQITRVILNSGKCITTHGIGGYSSRRKILHAKATKAQIAEMHLQAKHVLENAIALGRLNRPHLDQVSIGIIGQPNTGKSSLVNSILGRHAVSVSRTCGHTKHWQTQLIKNENEEIIATIIDSPGIIFPMAVDNDEITDEVSPRAWFECAGLYPIAQIRETFSAIRFAGERIDLPRLYNLKLNTDDYGDEWSPYAFIGSLADKRGYTLQRGGGAPDMHRAGLETINDICDGVILLCFPPPNIETWREKVKKHE